jgi:hypothetical protein
MFASYRNSRSRQLRAGLAALTAALAFLAAPAFTCAAAAPDAGSPAAAPADTPEAMAVWVPKELTFLYRGFTTRYTCDGLRDKVRTILLQLGARDDLKVIPFGCVRNGGPEATPGVRIEMHVLQLAGATTAQAVTAHWQTVNVLAGQTPVSASLDCELVSQLHREVLPLFGPREIDYRATCSAYQPIAGGTRLKAEVLVADAAAPVAAAR